MTQPPGPLAVSSANPRYFTATAAPEQAVYLTGSHVNNKWHSLPSRETSPGAALIVPDDAETSISTPSEIAGPAVVHLRRISS